MLGNPTPSIGISVFVHMCHVVDTLWCTGALLELPDVQKGTQFRVFFGGVGGQTPA